MCKDSVDYEKGETPMPDYQFKCYEELRNKCGTLEKKNAYRANRYKKLKGAKYV